MARALTLAAAQLGPIQKAEPREEAVGRMVRLMERAHRRGAEAVVFPELALTTFFPRWYEEDVAAADRWFETALPSPATAPLFDAAKRFGIGFHLGYAEKTPDGRRFNTAGATASIYGGLIAAVVLVVFSPVGSGTETSLFPDADFAWFPLRNPGLVSIPIGFLCGIIGTLASKDETSIRRYDELEVRSLTGAGAEKASSH